MTDVSLGAVERLAAACLYRLSERLGILRPEEQSHGLLGGSYGYGQDFSNDVFEMHPYWWGDCTCGAGDWSEEGQPAPVHKPECRMELPNFRCGDLAISWYKYIGRGMSANRATTEHEIASAFARCMASLPEPTAEQERAAALDGAASDRCSLLILRRVKASVEESVGQPVRLVIPTNEQHRAKGG
jgi:hypothetical protein